jgi:glycosyltransferase involved in cell wall biosynthesis
LISKINISVVITYFNKGILLVEAIESIIESKEIYEIIVVDDCSTNNNSINVLSQINNKYPDIKNIKTKNNLGASGAKNFGIEHAKGNVIVLLDADDTLPINAIEDIADSFEKSPEVDVLFGNYTINNENVNCSRIENDETLNIEELAKKWILLGSSPFRKIAWHDIGGFDKMYPKTDDIDFHIKMILSKKNFKYINKNIYNWNLSEDGNCKTKTRIDSAYSIFRNIEFYFRYLGNTRFVLKYLKNIMILFYKKLFYHNKIDF